MITAVLTQAYQRPLFGHVLTTLVSSYCFLDIACPSGAYHMVLATLLLKNNWAQKIFKSCQDDDITAGTFLTHNHQDMVLGTP